MGVKKPVEPLTLRIRLCTFRAGDNIGLQDCAGTCNFCVVQTEHFCCANIDFCDTIGVRKQEFYVVVRLWTPVSGLDCEWLNPLALFVEEPAT